MKKLILLFIFALIGCKKVYIVNEEPVNVQMIEGSATFTFNKTKVTLFQGQWYTYEGIGFKVTDQKCLTPKCVYRITDSKGSVTVNMNKI